MCPYSDLIQINQDFIDVFSAEVDSQHRQAWKSFIPHEAMQQVLTGLINTLERTRAKSLWIHGPYGTGKTYCQFVLKHMLEDPWPEVESYFKAHNLGPDSRRRLQAIREQGEGLVVFLSGSAYIDSNRKFMAALEQAIKRALEERGVSSIMTHTLYDSVLSKISGPDSPVNWTQVFEKHRGDFFGLADSSESVIKQLQAKETSNDVRYRLMERVAKALDDMGFVTLDSADRVKDWLREIIQENHLPWLLVIWDEFTEFFLHNAGFDGLQELAHLSAEAPFYLLVTTHKAPQTLELGRSEDWRKVRDRFELYPYSMEPITAYRLMGGVLQVNKEVDLLWEDRSRALWSGVRSAVRWILGEGEPEVRQQEFQQLVPIHPYTSYSLSVISQRFTAAQRTLFGFLKGDRPHGFARFLADYPQDGWDWYTADGLWDYFFAGDNPDLPEEFRDVISYYRNGCDRIEDAYEGRAFKAVMLLIALERALPGERRVLASLSNLQIVFSGTPLQDRINGVMQTLSERDLVRRVPSMTENRTQFTIPQGSLDPERLKQIKAGLSSFATECESRGNIGSKLEEVVIFRESLLARRQEVTVISSSELGRRRERVNPRHQPYQVGVVWVIPETTDEAVKATGLLADLAKEQEDVVYALLQDPFGPERFRDYQDNMAYSEYYKELKDAQNMRFHHKRAEDCIRDWLMSLRGSRILVFADTDPKLATGLEAFQRAIQEVIDRRFRYRPELISPSVPLYRESYGSAGAEVGLGIKPTAQPYSQLVPHLQRDGLWPEREPLSETKLRLYADNPLAQMKAVVDEAFQGNTVELNALWSRLQEPPYGLMPSPIGITLMGLMLREYCKGYYWQDGTNSRPLDPTRMADLINDVMHEKQNVTLQRTSQEAQVFCQLLREIFGLSETDAPYPEPAREALRTWLTRMGYPLWSLNCYLQEQGRPELESIAELQQVLASTEPKDVCFSQERLGKLIALLQRDRRLLESLVREDRFETGVDAFIAQRTPAFENYATTLGLSMRDIMGRLREFLSEEVWLWKECDIAERLPVLQIDLALVAGINQLSGAADTKLSIALTRIDAFIKKGKLPLFVFAAHSDSETGAMIGHLEQLCRVGRNYTGKQPLVDGLGKHSEQIQALLQSPVQALQRWMASTLQVEASAEEVQEIWSTLPDLSTAIREDEVQQPVEARLADLAKRRTMEKLRRTWSELTGSRSPDEWSNAHGIPIGWVLEGADFRDLFATLNRPESYTAQSLERVLELMREKAGDLQVLRNGQVSDQLLLRVVGNTYEGLVRSEDLADLKVYLGRHSSTEVSRWERSEIQRLAQQWVRSVYRERMYERVVRRIKETPETQIRALIMELVTDPQIGVRLLELENRKHADKGVC